MSGDQTPSDPEAVFRRAIEEGFDKQNKDIIMETFADSVKVLQSSFADTYTPEQLWQEHQVEVSAFPDFTHDIQQIWQTDGMVFAQYEAEATFENEFVLGEDIVFEPTGEQVETTGIMMARVEDGQITGWGAYWERLDLFQQAGIIPPLEELAD